MYRQIHTFRFRRAYRSLQTLGPSAFTMVRMQTIHLLPLSVLQECSKLDDVPLAVQKLQVGSVSSQTPKRTHQALPGNEVDSFGLARFADTSSQDRLSWRGCASADPLRQ